ncbi:substrate-binding domain-containing protein [Kribbella sp. NBC_01245]|uniref:substrate-binding domain-containing protein n=1 Tax=Kribbella sp. NBC_01245 TaxID=2903578 RepID=UPI002E28D2F7|nr:substrate-binding domain-containing protein [Kribbella sp. NBC_01245]
MTESNAVAPPDPVRRLTIGLVTANVSVGVGATLWSAVLDAAERHDVNLICFPGGEVRTTERPPNSVYDLVDPELLDGLICWTSALELPADERRTNRWAERFARLPLVSLNGTIGAADPLVLDSYRGMCAVVEHLIEVHGRTRIAFIPGTAANPATAERLRAYADTLARRRLRLDRKLISTPADSRTGAGASAMHALLDARGLQPGRDFDAVVACSDLLAAEALRVLSGRGVVVPQDVAVAGFNDSPEARLTDPPLTSVSMPFDDLGDLAVETLLQRLGDIPVTDRPPPQSNLVIRRSCGCPGSLVAEPDAQLGGLDALPPLPREFLLSAFDQAIDGDSTAFLIEIDRLVRTWATTPDQLDSWAAAIGGLHGRGDPEVVRLIGQARLIVAEAAHRHLEAERWRTDQAARRLRELGNALSSAVDVAALEKVLDRHLPELGIPAWHLSLESRAAVSLAEVLPSGRRYSMVAEPLYVRDELLGFGLFEVGSRDGAVYRALGEQISHTLMEIRLFQDVLDARDSAEQANQAKSGLLASVGEVLREPVVGVLRQLATLRRSVAAMDAPPVELVNGLARIRADAEIQLRVIGNLLDLSRIEIDAVDLSPTLLDPGELLSEVFGQLLRADSVPARLPLIQADRDRLRQALIALRVSTDRLAGKVALTVDVLPPSLRIQLRVVCGYRLPPDSFGAGPEFALPIAQRLIALHDGSLRFEPGPDGGTFQVDLPLPTPSGRRGVTGPTSSLLSVGEAAEAPGIATRLGVDVRRLRTATDNEAIGDLTRPVAVALDLAGLRTEDWPLVRHLHDHPSLRRTPFLVYGRPDAGSRGLTELLAAARPAGATAPVVVADGSCGSRFVRIVEQVLPGHPVLTAADGTTALTSLGPDLPGLLILTKTLPDMSAFDVLDRLAHEGSPVPALVLSSGPITSRDVLRAEPHPRVVLIGEGILSEAELTDLLVRLLAPGHTAAQGSKARVRQAVAYLHQRFHHPISRRQVAEAAGMSEDYLSRVFHRELGLSPWLYLNRLRIQQAKERLRNTNDSVQLVARRVGFRDRAYFSRTFRKLTGISPQAFREGTPTASGG